MIHVLDTNVVSELLRPHPDPAVVRFVDGLTGDGSRLTSISVAELVFGARRLPVGRRGDLLRAAVDAVIEAFVTSGRCLDLDAASAATAANLRADAEAQGRPMSLMDSLIAGICATNLATLVTRNVRDFELAPIAVVDPWSSGRTTPGR